VGHGSVDAESNHGVLRTVGVSASISGYTTRLRRLYEACDRGCKDPAHRYSRRFLERCGRAIGFPVAGRSVLGATSARSAAIVQRIATPMSTLLVIAQSTGGAGPMFDPGFLLMMLTMLGIFYFMMLRPQQQKANEFQEMISKIRRGDTVVTAGGLVGRVSKVTDGSDEVEVELNDQMKVRVLKSTLMSVRSKNEPVKETS